MGNRVEREREEKRDITSGYLAAVDSETGKVFFLGARPI